MTTYNMPVHEHFNWEPVKDKNRLVPIGESLMVDVNALGDGDVMWINGARVEFVVTKPKRKRIKRATK